MTTKLNTLELDGWLLDYFTGKALGYEMLVSNDGAGPVYQTARTDKAFTPTTDRRDLQPAILQMRAMLRHSPNGGAEVWHARAQGGDSFATSPDFAQAVCRALVFARLGASVEHPCPPADGGCDDLFA